MARQDRAKTRQKCVRSDPSGPDLRFDGEVTESVLLLAADPRRRARLLGQLETLGFAVESSRWLSEAHRRAGRLHVDVVLIDAHSLDIPATVADLAVHDIPIVVLSSQGHRGAVAALASGAADHVQEPVHPDELAARLRGAVRRLGHAADPPLETCDFVLFFAERRAVRDGQEVHLTPTEWAMVELLARTPGQVVTQDRILTEVWGIDGRVRSGYVRVYMNTIRRKLEPDPTRPRYFRTVHGIGVRLELEPASASTALDRPAAAQPS
jgi:two-component system KDP operon response regulator KdpE